jgi:phosphoribosyl 1,2-cyclic phosphodiesterase
MSLDIASLNSGSNGNCYYVANERDAILVDAGLSCRETERRMLRLGLDIGKVRALFISHEHSDHIRGVEVLARKYKWPVYITPATMRGGNLMIDPAQVRSFRAHEPVAINELVVTPFPKLHDAADPHSFIVSGNGVNIGVLTDIGAVCSNVIQYFSLCHAVFLEANYDPQMLDAGYYPYHLKRRIRGGRGHLSNNQALQLMTAHRGSQLKHVLLSHLSKDNNDPELALEVFREFAHEAEITVASRYNESPVLTIHATAISEPEWRRALIRPQPVQMSLF